MANIINYYVDMWRNFANFGGRTNIPGCWWASLANFVVSTVLSYIPYVGPLYALAVLIPGLAITVRRLNDAGKHWSCMFINLIPLVGQIIFIIMLCKPSKDSNIVDAL
jgi:uncharacterized membrane protein YhaH (DUF805 family)